jgi:hypothetical protein
MIELRQDPDRVPGRRMALSGLIVLAVIVGSVVVVVLLTLAWRGRLASNPGRGILWEERIPQDRSHVETAIFGRPTDAELDARAARQRLGSYGWVDPAHGRVHVPIDVAMDRYLAGASR